MISIVIPCYGRADMTAACLQSIDENTRLDHELVLVDNGSPDGETWDLIGQTDCVSVFLSENVNYGRGANIGAIASSGDLIVFLNNDTEVRAGWLEPLVDAFSDKEVGIAAGRLEDPDGTLQHAGVTLFMDRGTLTAANVTTEEPSRELDVVAGTAMMIRRECFQSSGGHDPVYRNGYEDVDLCLRARAAGWKVRYCAESNVMHHKHQSGPSRWAYVREITTSHDRP